MNDNDGSLLLSIDELRAAARLAGVPVPPLVADDDPDDPRIDLAALRGLTARGLVSGLAIAEPDPAGDLVAPLAALDEPAWLLDVEIDRAGDGDGGASAGRVHRWNHVEGQRGLVALTAMPGGCVHIDPAPGADHLARLTESIGLTSDSRMNADQPGKAPIGDTGPDAEVSQADDQRQETNPHRARASGFEVSTEAHIDADAHVLDGDLTAAERALISAGADADVARQWVEAVDTRRCAAAVRVVRQLDGDVVELRELRWLVGGDGQVWRVEGSGPAEGDPAGDDISRVQVTDPGELRSALAGLLHRRRP